MTIMSLPTELHIMIFSYVCNCVNPDSPCSFHINTICFGLACKEFYLIYRNMKPVRRWGGGISLWHRHKVGQNWVFLFEVLREWMQPLIFNYQLEKFVALERHQEIDEKLKAEPGPPGTAWFRDSLGK